MDLNRLDGILHFRGTESIWPLSISFFFSELRINLNIFDFYNLLVNDEARRSDIQHSREKWMTNCKNVDNAKAIVNTSFICLNYYRVKIDYLTIV